MTTATGAWSLAQKYAADTLAACAEWQGWVDAANASQAASRIYQDALPGPRHGNDYTLDELQTYRPFALIGSETEQGFRSERIADGTVNDAGVILIEIEDDIPDAIEDQPGEIALRLRNHVGTLIAELFALHGTAGYLAIEAIDVDGPYRTRSTAEETVGRAQVVVLRCEWGTTGG
jgi:hypothetical protein